MTLMLACVTTAEIFLVSPLIGLTLNSGSHLPKRAFKKHINDMLFSLLEAEDGYVESPILLQKIANY